VTHGDLAESFRRRKRFPVLGLGLMTAALVLLSIVSCDPSRTATAIGVGVFGLGFGMVTQILVVAVQNTVDRRESGIATATTSFFRGLGRTAGAAVFGAVFAARAGRHTSPAGLHARGRAAQPELIGAVQKVFLVAAPLAAIGAVIALPIPEVPPQVSRPGGSPAKRA
jgi:predicted MFS family arabinose efflux permease